MRAGYPRHLISDMEIRQEASCRGPKVGQIAPTTHRLLMLYREFQLFLLGYIIIEICEIFTVGGFPLDSKVRMVQTYSSSLLRRC
jgi:hypothetical protein